MLFLYLWKGRITIYRANIYIFPFLEVGGPVESTYFNDYRIKGLILISEAFLCHPGIAKK